MVVFPAPLGPFPGILSARAPAEQRQDAVGEEHDTVDDAGKLVGILTTTDALEALTWFSRQARDAAEQGAPPLGSPRFPS
jgi:hypothetical protein